jgi:hypothetical protein
VGREQDRLPGRRELRDRRAQVARTNRVDADRRLVEEDHRRVMEQAAGDL